jgi:aldehyde:ferredoxin oxidoreductase
MPFGWTGRTLYVDLTLRKMDVRDTINESHEYIGGRALAARWAWREIPADVDAYDPENLIIITTGPLTGTLAPTSGRTIMASVSPRVYPKPWYTHSTVGGWFGPQLKYSGFDAVVLAGKARVPVYVEIQNDSVRIIDAQDLWGLDARETQLKLKSRMGEQVQILTIGQAGENLVRFSTVQHSEENAAGHSGFGAVWGSKNLKAVAVLGSGGVAVANSEALVHEVLGSRKRKYSNFLGFLYDEGKFTMTVCSQACIFDCLYNFYGQTDDGRRIPANCIGTAWTVAGEIEHTRYSGGGLEMPAGKNFELKKEVPLHELCNSLGLDLWFRLTMQPWFIRCRQLGISKIRGHRIDPEDASWFEDFMYQLANREGLGEIFAEDLIRAVDQLEEELPRELIELGRTLEFNFGFPAHREGRFWDEEPLPFWVISAMMHISANRDPTIGTHLSSLMLAELLLNDRELALKQFRSVSERVWGYADALEPTFKGKAPVAIWSQHQHIIIDSLPLCDFAFPQLIRALDSREEWQKTEDMLGDLDKDLRLFTAVTGQKLNREEITRIAERAFTLERLMLARAGRTRKMEEQLASHFKLPCRADGTSIDRDGFLKLMDEYYTARGWDLELGWPQDKQLQALGLGDAVPELRELRARYGSVKK